MRSTVQDLREHIRDTLLIEAALGPNDLPDGYFIRIWQRRSDRIHIGITNSDSPGATDDFVEIGPGKKSTGPCAGGWQVRFSQAESPIGRGFGPLLYDVAIEVTGQVGLMADRGSVSSDALRVWSYYVQNRQSEFEFKKLDMTDTVFRSGFLLTPDDHITPDDLTDDCSSWSIIDHVKDGSGQSWEEHPLNFLVRRKGGATPTIDALDKLGKLTDLRNS